MNSKPDELDTLRLTAEAQLAHAKKPVRRTDKELLHELQVHQIELEMQNENLRQTQIQLEESRDRYVEFYDFAPVGYLTLDHDALITEINLTGAALLGKDRSKFLQRRFTTMVAPEDRNRWHLYFVSVLQHDNKQTCELCILRGDGSHLEVQLDSLCHVKDGDTKIVRIVLTDITERKAVEKRMGYLATHDSMTELPNRELFYDRLSQAISQSKRKSEPLAVLFLDLDGFKSINDSYGHEAGDAVLKLVATRLQQCIRSMDTVARIGGDEFAIILNDVEQREAASGVAKKIIHSLADSMKLNETTDCRIGVSIGIAIYPQHGPEIDKLMHAADTAMYQSKAGGKNCFTFFEEQGKNTNSNEPWIYFDSTRLVGVRLIDQQHEELAGMLNQLNETFHNNESTEIITRILDGISTFTQFHFDTEELLMEQYKYPDILDHIREHQNLLNELAFLKNKFLGGGEALVMQTLKNWLLLHIINFDKPLAVYLIKQHGVE